MCDLKSRAYSLELRIQGLFISVSFSCSDSSVKSSLPKECFLTHILQNTPHWFLGSRKIIQARSGRCGGETAGKGRALLCGIAWLFRSTLGEICVYYNWNHEQTKGSCVKGLVTLGMTLLGSCRNLRNRPRGRPLGHQWMLLKGFGEPGSPPHSLLLLGLWSKQSWTHACYDALHRLKATGLFGHGPNLH